MTTPERNLTLDEFSDLVDAAAAAVLNSPDPPGTARRLKRHLAREAQFLASPASMSVDEVAAAKSSGVPVGVAAASPRRRRVSVHG
jgi:hypothetical protein